MASTPSSNKQNLSNFVGTSVSGTTWLSTFFSHVEFLLTCSALIQSSYVVGISSNVICFTLLLLLLLGVVVTSLSLEATVDGSSSPTSSHCTSTPKPSRTILVTMSLYSFIVRGISSTK